MLYIWPPPSLTYLSLSPPHFPLVSFPSSVFLAFAGGSTIAALSDSSTHDDQSFYSSSSSTSFSAVYGAILNNLFAKFTKSLESFLIEGGGVASLRDVMRTGANLLRVLSQGLTRSVDDMMAATGDTLRMLGKAAKEWTNESFRRMDDKERSFSNFLKSMVRKHIHYSITLYSLYDITGCLHTSSSPLSLSPHHITYLIRCLSYH